MSKSRTVQKGEIIQKPGELGTKVYMVKSGLLRSYSMDENGREHIFMFAPEGWIIADSVPAHVSSEIYIDALEESIILVREKDIQKEKDFAKFARRLLVLQRRVIMLMSATAMERYEHFLSTYPEIVQRVPQKMIASYLGITPEALSTVKRAFLKR
ncbi:MAG: Crp/Fnr family transcriptional regulator [Bacteroidota bacterium]